MALSTISAGTKVTANTLNGIINAVNAIPSNGLTATHYSAGKYIRLSNGFQLCTGTKSHSSIDNATITFPKAFSAIPTIAITSTNSCVLANITKTSFTIDFGGSAAPTSYYIALGYS